NKEIRFRFLFSSLLFYFLIYLPYFLWRFNYYGFLFPNTFYAKTGGGIQQFYRGLDYLTAFLGEFFWFPLPLAFLFVLFFLRRNLALLLFWGVSIIYVIYVVCVGGDFKYSYRFFLPLLAPLCLIYQAAWAEAFSILSKRASGRLTWFPVAAVALSILLGIHLYLGSEDLRNKYDRIKAIGFPNYVDRAKVIGRWIQERAEPGDILAISTAGAIPYFSDIPVIDMYGLNDLHIARAEKPSNFGAILAGHGCGDGKYVLSRKPRFILFRGKMQDSPKAPSEINTTSLSELQILALPDFKDNYRARTFPVYDEYCVIYCRKNSKDDP
ncbi:MAG: hypothetical protein KJ645_04355, partial [Planctomycetes bacterium]|nr:hypothetical protein [Planctomycetota bacterium]